MDWSLLAPLIAAVAASVGLGRLLELLVTRRKLRGESQRIEVDAGKVISEELRAWADKAEARARAAEARADAVMARLDQAEEEVDHLRARVAKLEGRILRCQAGPVCPVRTAATDPGIQPVRG